MSPLQKLLFSQKQSMQLLEHAADLVFKEQQCAAKRPVFPSQTTLNRLNEFSSTLPEDMGDASSILARLADIGGQNTVLYNGRYFGFVNGGVLPIGQASRWIADSWDQNAALFVMSPIAAKLEQLCQQWLTELFGLPPKTAMGLVTGTSVATLCALAAARYRQLHNLGWDIEKNGLFSAPTLRIILAKKTHGTVLKMLKLLGFGEQHFEWVDCDEQGRMQVAQIPDFDRRCILVLQAGNVCTGAFDHFSDIIPKAKQAGAWVHIDGAFGLWAAASKSFSSLTKDLNLADSWSVDGHKTLNTPYDCGVVLCADEPALRCAMDQQGSYIQSSEQRDSMNYTPDMSRRATGIDLWACLSFLGRHGIAQLIDTLHHHAVYFAENIKAVGFTVINHVVFNQVLIRCDSDQLTQSTLEHIQASGIVWCGGASWHDKQVIRMSLCSWETTTEDIDTAIKTFSDALERAKLQVNK